MEDVSSDRVEREGDFFARHGGQGTRAACKGRSANGDEGWSEVYARDGYVLRCDWSRLGTREEMKYTEVAPSDAVSPTR